MVLSLNLSKPMIVPSLLSSNIRWKLIIFSTKVKLKILLTSRQCSGTNYFFLLTSESNTNPIQAVSVRRRAAK